MLQNPEMKKKTKKQGMKPLSTRSSDFQRLRFCIQPRSEHGIARTARGRSRSSNSLVTASPERWGTRQTAPRSGHPPESYLNRPLTAVLGIAQMGNGLFAA